MTQEQEAMLNRINKYADEVMPDIDPRKVPISFQLEKLKPVMEAIAGEQSRPLEDVFIEYMDLASEFSVRNAEKFRKDFVDFENVN